MAKAPLALCILTVSLALAGQAGADEAPTAASAPAAPVSVADQIDQYLKSSRMTDLPTDAAPGVTSGAEERKVHGEVSVAVGSQGYRSAYVRTDLPVGKTGTLSIAVQETRFNGRFGPRDYRSVGLGLDLSGAAPDAAGLPCQGRWDDHRPRLDDPLRIDGAAAGRRCQRPDAPPFRP